MQTQTPYYISTPRERIQICIFSILCFFAFTYNLSEVPPYHADENFYVTSTRNMIDSGDYITPTYHGKERFAKPILFYWLVAASYKMFGTNLFSARLVSAFFGTLCIPIVYFMAYRMFDKKTALISALLLPCCYLHFQISRWATPDMTLNFSILMALYFFMQGLQNLSNQSTSYYLAYLFMGIGFMIKGPPALLIPGLVVGGFILILRDRKKLSELRIRHGVGILLALILPWFIAMFSIHGNEFKNHILGAELRDRIVHDTSLSLYYFWVTIRYYLPWSLFFIIALAVRFGLILVNPVETFSGRGYFSSLNKKLKTCFLQLTEKENQSFLFCLLWVFIPILLFTLLRIEHSRYMLPISPPIAIITAKFLSQLLDSPNNFCKRIFKIPFYLIKIFYFLIAIFIGIAVISFNSILQAPLTLMSLPIFIIFGIALLFLLHKTKKYFSIIITLSIMQIITFALLSGDGLPFFNRYPMKSFAKKILDDSQTNIKIGIYQLGNHRARMGVLTGLPSIYLNSADELIQFIQSEKSTYVVMQQTKWKNKFFDLPMTVKATDAGWIKPHKNKLKIDLILEAEIESYLKEHSESYVLLKSENKG